MSHPTLIASQASDATHSVGCILALGLSRALSAGRMIAAAPTESAHRSSPPLPLDRSDRPDLHRAAEKDGKGGRA